MTREATKAGGGALSALDGVRGFAASYVVLHHAGLGANSGWGHLLHFGQEAVILFFLMSGFVIRYSTSRPGAAPTTRAYLLHRFRRIYPLLVIALASAWLASSLEAGHRVALNAVNLIENLLMLQDVPELKRGVLVATYQGNSPLWSLSYEWWFYLLFIPLGLRWRGAQKAALRWVSGLSIGGFISYQIFPNQLSLFLAYFMIWWMGVQCAQEFRETGTLTFRGQRAALSTLALCAALWTLPVVHALAHGVPLRLGTDPVLQARHFSFALVATLVGLAWYRVGAPGFSSTLGRFAVLAPISYALYILHWPVLHGLAALGLEQPALRLGAAVLVLLPLCYLLEVKLQPLINRLFDARLPRREETLTPPSPQINRAPAP